MKRAPLLTTPIRWTERRPLQLPNCPPTRVFTAGDLQVLVGREPIGPDDAMQWHLSISAVDRYPSWDEIADARERFLPDELTFGMILPPRAKYVNLHQTTFHLHEMDP